MRGESINKKYIDKIRESCSLDNSFIVFLNRRNLKKGINILLDKSIVLAEFGGAMIRAKYKQYVFTLFPDGRVIFQDISKSELEKILEEIFRE